MIKHIVMWRLKDHAMGTSKSENAGKLKALLEALSAKKENINKLLDTPAYKGLLDDAK